MGVAFQVTPDVQRYDEALDWFGKRLVMTASDARKLDDDTKIHAFWVGGGLQLEQVQRVFNKLNAAIERGDTFHDFKKAVLPELRNAAHVETVFRNATQRAYNAGRWRQMREESTAKFRPYWLYDSLLDSRTTEICIHCNGTLLPIEHPWWKTHVPPLHHRCRSSLRNLRRAEAEKRGISAAPPDPTKATPPKGWGNEPSDDPRPWKPNPSKYDKQLLLDFEGKAAEGEKSRKKQEHDPATYVPLYEPKYGAQVAKSLARGKASRELGLDLPVQEVREQLKKLDTPGVSALLEACEDCDADRTLREQAGEKLDPMKEAAAALAGHLHDLPARDVDWKHAGLAKLPEGERTQKLFSKLTAPAVTLPDDKWRFELTPIDSKTKARQLGGYTSASQRLVVYDETYDTVGHELGHAIEDLNVELFQRAVEFLRVRRAKEARILMGFTPDGRPVYAWQDGFLGLYTGRDYGESQGKPYGTEITSTALELLVAGDTEWGSLRRLMQKDPEHWFFMLGQLAGP